jgi:hypothetical protein
MADLLLFAPALRACAVAASSNPDTPALSHILVEPFNDRFRYVATDGHVLLAVEAPGPIEMLLGLEAPEQRIYIHRDAVARLLPSSRSMEVPVAAGEFLKDPGFPKYRKLVERFGSTEQIGTLSLGIPILKKLAAIGAALGCAAMNLQSTGKNSAATLQIDLGDVQAYGLVMPVATRRQWDTPATITAWFAESSQAAS